MGRARWGAFGKAMRPDGSMTLLGTWTSGHPATLELLNPTVMPTMPVLWASTPSTVVVTLALAMHPTSARRIACGSPGPIATPASGFVVPGEAGGRRDILRLSSLMDGLVVYGNFHL